MNHVTEFEYTEEDFQFLSRLASDYAGINLPETKRQLIYSRLTKRLRELGIYKFREYCNILENGDDSELKKFVNSITTNVTNFFRENHHFEFFSRNIIPEILEKNRMKVRPKARFWSAGCSTGEEPYSLAIIMKENMPDLNKWDAKILATDLDTDVLRFAKNGKYKKEKINGILPEKVPRYFDIENIDNDKTLYVIKNEFRKLVQFNQLNLLHNWPMNGQFDAILCRNVTIYFKHEVRKILADRFAEILFDGGYLMIGHSETLFGLSDRFKSIGTNIYQKIK